MEGLNRSDIYHLFPETSDAEYFGEVEYRLAQNRIIFSVQILKSFATSKRISVVVPPQSRLASVENIQLNRFDV